MKSLYILQFNLMILQWYFRNGELFLIQVCWLVFLLYAHYVRFVFRLYLSYIAYTISVFISKIAVMNDKMIYICF